MAGAFADPASAKTAKEINDNVNACLGRFYKQVSGGKDLAAKAKRGFGDARVIKAGLIIGGEYGEGLCGSIKKPPATTTSPPVDRATRSAERPRTS